MMAQRSARGQESCLVPSSSSSLRSVL
uniref:Uncharacterized protein n=1 Tax=Anguilla anguilla TaxID=7936 RepID=A0A0E9XQ37_ANGAN